MRAFIAIDLPDAVRGGLARWQKTFGAVCRDARWTRPEGIHLTLKFLGEISSQQVNQVSKALADLGAIEPIRISIRGFGFFPNARRPRVFWAGISSSQALSALASRVEAAMETMGFAREQREYNPHLTLARFKMPRPQPELATAVEKQGELDLGSFEASEFYMFESVLSLGSAQYRKVARFPENTSSGQPNN
ncbi:MAG: RNA 2',3'-cyclic phosphodiesterase [Deltaproteobacteria bacterium]